MKKLIMLACLFSIAVLAACGDTPLAPSTKVVGELQLTLTTDPSPPTNRVDVALRIEVKDTSGNPVEGAVVEMVADMVTMSHPGNNGTMTDKGNGIYEAPAHFVMGGIWRVEVVATKDGGKRTTGTFDIEVKDADILR